MNSFRIVDEFIPSAFEEIPLKQYSSKTFRKEKMKEEVEGGQQPPLAKGKILHDPLLRVQNY